MSHHHVRKSSLPHCRRGCGGTGEMLIPPGEGFIGGRLTRESDSCGSEVNKVNRSLR